MARGRRRGVKDHIAMSMNSGDQQLFVNGQFVHITGDMHEYLKQEAERLKITEAEAYERFQAADAEKVTELRNYERLLEIAKKNPPPQAWFDEDEDLFS